MAQESTTPAPKAYSGQDIADALGVQGIQLRRYVRSDGTRVGRGRTYKFSTEEAIAIAQGYAATQEKSKKLTEDQATKVAALFAAEEEPVKEGPQTEEEAAASAKE